MAKQLKKWNWKTREYENYEVPDNWNVRTFAFDMDTFVDCAQCGEGKAYGRMYTSMEVHTDSGIGYCVCGNCYEEEDKRRWGK